MALLAVSLVTYPSAVQAGGEDPPEVALGGRLFLETRFAQYFFAHSKGKINAPLAQGDPVMEKSATTGDPLAGPFSGQSMNCRACHLVNEFRETPGIRSYADFARRSPIPAREDGLVTTARNSPPLVTAARKENCKGVLHLDGQFATMLDLVETTYTGRNFGWMPDERATAIRHFARVIREDDGSSPVAQDRSMGYSYSVLFSSAQEDIFRKLRLPESYRLEVGTATDEQIFERACQLVAAYVESLKFRANRRGEFDASPYDAFLKKNGLARAPRPIAPGLLEKESDLSYARYLRKAIDSLADPQWVGALEGRYFTHHQEFKFGPEELAGLKIFLVEAPAGADATSANHFGNCIQCHAPPSFTDFGFHNTGATQEEYDSLHETGAFARLLVPDFDTRNKDYDGSLPPTPSHPRACGRFASAPDSQRVDRTDLGVWNVFANPDIPNPQARLRQLLFVAGAENSEEAILNRSIACFKTPSLRDLGHGAPYLHNGSKNTIEDVLQFYRDFSELARKGLVRNADPHLGQIFLDSSDLPQITAFLQSLNEDYDD